MFLRLRITGRLPAPRPGRAYSEGGIGDNNKSDSSGFAGHGNQCSGRERLFHRGDLPSAVPGPCRRSKRGVVAIGRCTRRRREFLWLCWYWGRSTSRRPLRCCSWVRSPAPCNCSMPESVCMKTILGNALGRSLSLSSNSSWCICFTDPCRSHHKPGTDSPNVATVAPVYWREPGTL